LVIENIKNGVNTQAEMEEKIPKLIYPAYEALQKMLIDCGRIKKEATFDNHSLKVVIQSIIKIQKNLDSNNASQSIQHVLNDLSSCLSADMAS
jgi:hypothetical protein